MINWTAFRKIKKLKRHGTQKSKISKARKSFLKLEKDFRELKYREIKIRKETEYLFTKPELLPRPKIFFYQNLPHLPRPGKLVHSPIDMSVEDMDNFEEKELMKKIPFMKILSMIG